MNNIFNAIRFQKLFVKHTTENYRNYIVSMAVLFGMISLFYFFFVVDTDSKTLKIRIIGLMALYLLAGCIFTSSIFSDFSLKRRAIASLSLPASLFEKFLVGWIYSFLIFSTVYMLTYAIVDYVFLPFIISTDKQILIELIQGPEILALMVLYYAFLHSITIFGAIWFDSAHFIKTAAVLFIVIIIFCLGNSWFLDSIISQEELGFTLPLSNDLIIKTGGSVVYFRADIEKSQRIIYTLLLLLGVAFAMWAAAFYCLKEKEV